MRHDRPRCTCGRFLPAMTHPGQRHRCCGTWTVRRLSGLRAQWERRRRSPRRPWRFTRELAARGAREGWTISAGAQADRVERIDDPDDPAGPAEPLPDDAAAIALARAAGVPCDAKTGIVHY